MGVSIAKSIGARATLVASTGDAAASAAAYSARAGLDCLVVLPRGGVARGKLAQAILHGAKIVELGGNFDDALRGVLRVLSRAAGELAYPLNSINVWRLEGQKTLAYEVFEEIGVPDWVFVPVGNAGNIYAIWKEFCELHELGISDGVPKMVGVQAEGASPIATAWMRGQSRPEFVGGPKTVASAIRIGRPVNWYRAWRAVERSGGTFVVVSDSEILEAQRALGREGVAAEPAGAAPAAAYAKLLEEGVVDESDLTVLVVTGHGLKDPDVLVQESARLTCRAEFLPDAISKLLS